MKKFLSAMALCLLMFIGWASPSEATEPEPAVAAECVGEITGPGTATTNGECVLLAYRYADGAPGPDQLYTSLPQTLTDQDTGPAGTLTVTLPDCFWQVDLVDSDAPIVNPLTESSYYGSRGFLVDYEHGGSTVCSPPPPPPTTVTTTPPPPPTTVTTVPDTTTTTAPPVVTTVTTSPPTVPPTVVTSPPPPPSNPPTTELARTGVEKYRPLLALVFGLSLAGAAFMSLGWMAERRTS